MTADIRSFLNPEEQALLTPAAEAEINAALDAEAHAWGNAVVKDMGLPPMYPVGAKFYSEDQARDDHGRWTGGGDANAASPADKFLRAQDKLYPKAGSRVDGREVLDDVPNLDSISAGYNSSADYVVLPGIREVPLAVFGKDGENLKPTTMFYAADDIRRTEGLAGRIKESGQIKPLIVVIDQKGPYILEGGHRASALYTLGAKSFPAVVVVEKP